MVCPVSVRRGRVDGVGQANGSAQVPKGRGVLWALWMVPRWDCG